MEDIVITYVRDFLVVGVWPILAFTIKKVVGMATAMKAQQHEHDVRLSIAEAKLQTLSADIKEIKRSIDRLPGRIKSDIRELIHNGK